MRVVGRCSAVDDGTHGTVGKLTFVAAAINDRLVKITLDTTPAEMSIFLAAARIQAHMVIAMCGTTRDDERTDVATIVNQNMM